jgi:hypothetical protein
MVVVAATRAKRDPNLLSRSHSRYVGTCHQVSLLEAVRASQASVGDRVAPTWITRRDASSLMKKAKRGRKKRSVTCKKSQAQICAAWLCRNVAQFCPRGRGVRTSRIYF